MDDLTPEQEARLARLLKLDEEMISRLEKVAKEDERMEWLWALVRKSASGVALVLGAIVLMWDSLKNLVQGLVK